MICYVDSLNGVPRYQVAGSASCAVGAEKALKEAFKLHGGDCYYCGEKIEAGEVTIDHAHPRADGGRKELQNLLLSCRRCNQDKGRRPIELYNPEAGRAWLEAVLAQVQDRLNRI
jgi:5-methylcytosine-specific restriction endonuclease McrA